MPAAGKDLPPLVEGGDAGCEHDVELFEQAEPTRLAGWAVTGQFLLQEVPGDGEAGACPPEAVDMPADKDDDNKEEEENAMGISWHMHELPKLF